MPCLKNETYSLRVPEPQLHRTAKRSFKRECAGASQLFPVFPTPNQLINRVWMRRCSEILNTVMGAGSCTRKWPPGIFFKGSSEELKLNLGQHQHMEEAFISLNFNWTESDLFFIPLPPFSSFFYKHREPSRDFFVEFPKKKNQEWPFGHPWPPGGTPTTRARVFGNLRHYYKLWSSLGW